MTICIQSAIIFFSFFSNAIALITQKPGTIYLQHGQPLKPAQKNSWQQHAFPKTHKPGEEFANVSRVPPTELTGILSGLKLSPCRQKRVADAANYKPSESGHKVVLFGDSITESWKGTEMCSEKNPRLQGINQVFNETLAAWWPDTLPLGISGDKTEDLLWRILNGELSPAMAADPGVMFSVLIGSNDFGRNPNAKVDQVHQNIMTIVRTLLEKSKGKVLLNAILPRRDRPFTEHKIDDLNSKLPSSATAFAQEFPGRVDFVDCGEPFRKNMNQMMWRDRIHPNPTGHRAMAVCLRNALEKLESS